MNSSVYGKLTEYFEKRYLSSVLLPSLVFWVAVATLVISSLGWSKVVKEWRLLDTPTRLLLGAGALLFIILFANVISARLGRLVSLYEGYWPQFLDRWVTKRTRERHKRRLKQLKAAIDELDPRALEDRYLHYPVKEDDVQPTALGNILKSAESYPSEEGRYDIDAVFFWPRLYVVLPESLRSDLARARSTLDMLLLTASLAWSFVLLSTVYLLYNRQPNPLWWLLSVGGGGLVGYTAYKSSLSAALAFGELVRSSFDLYRHDLIKQMGFAVPTSLTEERLFWRGLKLFLYERLLDDPHVIPYASARQFEAEEITAESSATDCSRRTKASKLFRSVVARILALIR
jgi:hypothetical protein